MVFIPLQLYWYFPGRCREGAPPCSLLLCCCPHSAPYGALARAFPEPGGAGDTLGLATSSEQAGEREWGETGALPCFEGPTLQSELPVTETWYWDTPSFSELVGIYLLIKELLFAPQTI